MQNGQKNRRRSQQQRQNLVQQGETSAAPHVDGGGSVAALSEVSTGEPLASSPAISGAGSSNLAAPNVVEANPGAVANDQRLGRDVANEPFGWNLNEVPLGRPAKPARSEARIIPLYADRGPIPTTLPRPIMVRAFEMPAGAAFTPHSHDWGQLAYASEGITLVRTVEAAWTVPPAQAVWIPPHVEHDIKAPVTGAAFRSVYLDRSIAEAMGPTCRVLQVPRLLRELINHAAHCPVDYDELGPDGRLMRVLLDQILGLKDEKPLHLPMPKDARLRRLVDLLMQNPGDSRAMAVLAREVGASVRTLARRFVDETGLSLGDWRRRLKVVSAVERLSAGVPVTTVALDLGYESPSAFIAMFRKTVGCTPTAYLTRDVEKAR